jgi:hypothetical protein
MSNYYTISCVVLLNNNRPSIVFLLTKEHEFHLAALRFDVILKGKKFYCWSGGCVIWDWFPLNSIILKENFWVTAQVHKNTCPSLIVKDKVPCTVFASDKTLSFQEAMSTKGKTSIFANVFEYIYIYIYMRKSRARKYTKRVATSTVRHVKNDRSIARYKFRSILPPHLNVSLWFSTTKLPNPERCISVKIIREINFCFVISTQKQTTQKRVLACGTKANNKFGTRQLNRNNLS